VKAHEQVCSFTLAVTPEYVILTSVDLVHNEETRSPSRIGTDRRLAKDRRRHEGILLKNASA